MRAVGASYIQTPTYIPSRNARILLRCVSGKVVLEADVALILLQHFPFAHSLHVSPHVHPSSHVHAPELQLSHEHPTSHVPMSTNTHTFIKNR